MLVRASGRVLSDGEMTQMSQARFVRLPDTVGAVNETPGNSSRARTGRPRKELSASRKRTLERLAIRVTRHRADLGAARAEMAAAVREAHAEGASMRAIAEAVGLSRPRVHELLSNDFPPQ